MNKEHIDSLVKRLGRCVGGKLADDVAAAVQEMHAELALAQTRFEEQVRDKARILDEYEVAITGVRAERDVLRAEVRSLTALLDAVPQP